MYNETTTNSTTSIKLRIFQDRRACRHCWIYTTSHSHVAKHADPSASSNPIPIPAASPLFIDIGGIMFQVHGCDQCELEHTREDKKTHMTGTVSYHLSVPVRVRHHHVYILGQCDETDKRHFSLHRRYSLGKFWCHFPRTVCGNLSVFPSITKLSQSETPC